MNADSKKWRSFVAPLFAAGYGNVGRHKVPSVCGIYGFEITHQFSACGMQFVPLIASFREAQDSARALDQYNLTAVVIADDFPGDLLFCLEAVLSFIEHLDVIVTEPMLIRSPLPQDQFPKVLKTTRRHNGGGAIIGSDTFFPNSRATFIEKALQRLGDSAYCEATGYRILFFKTTETFRQRKPFIEVSYFLLFSGLETYVRRSLNDFESKDVAVLLNRQLRVLGFKVFSFSEAQLDRSMDTYARLRNALFHSSKFEAHRKIRGNLHTYRLSDFYAQFLILVALVVVKATDFDDGHLNWDAWIDRQLLK